MKYTLECVRTGRWLCTLEIEAASLAEAEAQIDTLPDTAFDWESASDGPDFDDFEIEAVNGVEYMEFEDTPEPPEEGDEEGMPEVEGAE
jgi:hypothetical protein